MTLTFPGGSTEVREPSRKELVQSARDWVALVKAHAIDVDQDLARGNVFRLPLMALTSAMDRLENAMIAISEFDAKNDPDAKEREWDWKNEGGK